MTTTDSADTHALFSHVQTSFGLPPVVSIDPLID